jgi:hypothetical protein
VSVILTGVFHGFSRSVQMVIGNGRFTGTSAVNVISECILYNNEVLVGDHLLLRDFGPYGIIFMNVCFCNRFHGNSVQRFRTYGVIFVTIRV